MSRIEILRDVVVLCADGDTVAKGLLLDVRKLDGVDMVQLMRSSHKVEKFFKSNFDMYDNLCELRTNAVEREMKHGVMR